MMAQDDDMMKMSISIYFKCQCRLPPYTPCVSIASCHSARGEEGQEQQIFIKYLSRANFTILPSLLIYIRYLLICWDLFVCSFASISANVGDLLVSEDPHYPHHAPNTGTAWIEMFAFLCNCRYFRPILCRIGSDWYISIQFLDFFFSSHSTSPMWVFLSSINCKVGGTQIQLWVRIPGYPVQNQLEKLEAAKTASLVCISLT